MPAPTTVDDLATAFGQANINVGTGQASVYNGTTSDPLVSARTLITLAGGETAIIGARRVDHSNITDYGFGALGIEYLLTTSGGLLIPDVAGLLRIDVLANDIPGASGEIDQSTLTVTSQPAGGAAVALSGLVYYAPCVGASGNDPFQYTVQDVLGNTSSASTVTVTISDAAAPTFDSTFGGIARGATVDFDPATAVGGDLPTNPVPQAVEIVSAPGRGSASVVGRIVRYIAPSDLVGTDSFVWRALFNGVWSTSATVTVFVGRAIKKPGHRRFVLFGSSASEEVVIQARADSASTPYITPVEIDVTANDTGDGLSISIISQPAHGVAALSSGNTKITYTPAVKFSGTDSFFYQITDGIRVAAARVTISVGPSPVSASWDFASTAPATPVEVDVLANDLGVGLFVASVSDPPHGTAVRSSANLKVTYTPDALWVGEDTCTVVVEDVNGNQSTSFLTVTTIAAIAAADDAATTAQGVAVIVSALANDTGTGLAIVAKTNGDNGTVAITGGGSTVTYTPSALFVGSDAFTYTAEDDFGQQRTATVRVTVTPTVPTVTAVTDTGTTVGVTPVEIDVLANDIGSSLIVSSVTQPTGGSAVGSVVRSSGNSKVTFTAAAGFSGTAVFTYTCAGPAGSSTASVSVTVTRPAMTLLDDAGVTDTNTPIAISPLANDSGTGLTLTSVGAVTPSTAGTAVRTSSSVATFTPNALVTGECSFPYTATDSSGFSASATITIKVNAAAAAAYANNYEQKIEAWIAPDSEAMTSFPVLFDITDPQLRSQANGGAVRTQFQDVRLEDGAGVKLSHGLLLHDLVAGRIIGVTKRTRSTGSTWVNVEVYCGKQGTVVDEQDWAGATTGHLAFIRTDTGIDLTGNARHLTAAGSPAAATLFGYPALAFDGVDDVLSLANPSAWLNGVSAYTILIDLQHSDVLREAGFVRIGGSTPADTDANCNVAARLDPVSFYAVPTVNDLYFAIQKTSISAVTTNCRVEGQANTLTGKSGLPTCFAMAWQSGQAQDFTSDGAAETEVYRDVATPTGTLVVPGGPLALGYGPRAAWAGIMGLFRIATTRRSAAWIVAEQRNRIRPLQMVAYGRGVGPAAAAAPVAFPDTASTTASTVVTISPLANDTGSGLTIVSASASAGSVAIITSSTQLRFTPTATAGEVKITYTIQNAAGQQSTSEVSVTVAAPPILAVDDGPFSVTAGVATILDVLANDVGTGLSVTAKANGAHGTVAITGGGANVTYTGDVSYSGSDSFTYTVTDNLLRTDTATVALLNTVPIADRPKTPGAATNTIRVPQDKATVALAYNDPTCVSGTHILVRSDIVTGAITFGRSFSTSNPVVIRAQTSTFPVFSGKITVTGVGHWFYELKTTYQRLNDAHAGDETDQAITLDTGSSYFIMTRCWLQSRGAFVSHTLAHHVWIGWNRFNGKATGLNNMTHLYIWQPEGAGWTTIAKGPHDYFIYRNFFFDNTSIAAPVQHEDHYIYSGPSKVSVDNIGQIPNGFIEENLIFSNGAGDPGRDRARPYYLKRGWVLRDNHCMVNGAGSDGFRHSVGGLISGNTFPDDLNVNGGRSFAFATVIGNAIGGKLLLHAGYGTKNPDPPHQAADYARVIGNKKNGGTLNIVIGEHGGSGATLTEDGNLDNPWAGGKTDHVTVFNGDAFSTSITRQPGFHDPLTTPTAASAGWNGETPVTPKTWLQTDVGLEIADQR